MTTTRLRTIRRSLRARSTAWAAVITVSAAVALICILGLFVVIVAGDEDAFSQTMCGPSRYWRRIRGQRVAIRGHCAR